MLEMSTYVRQKGCKATIADRYICNFTTILTTNPTRHAAFQDKYNFNHSVMALHHHLSSKANAVSFIMSFSVVTTAHHRAPQIAPQGATAAEMREASMSKPVDQWSPRQPLCPHSACGRSTINGKKGFTWWETWVSLAVKDLRKDGRNMGENKETDKGAWYHGKFVFIFTKML